MKNTIRALAALALGITTLSGCAIKQSVKPVERLDNPQVCIVLNPAVSQGGFLTSYTRVLSEKGYTVEPLPAGSPVGQCAVTSTYTANWSWDLALYMVYAEIKVYKNGNLSGEAIYDARGGDANMGKFIKGEDKITELVNQLFPGPYKAEK